MTSASATSPAPLAAAASPRTAGAVSEKFPLHGLSGGEAPHCSSDHRAALVAPADELEEGIGPAPSIGKCSCREGEHARSSASAIRSRWMAFPRTRGPGDEHALRTSL